MMMLDKSKVPDAMGGLDELYREIILEHFKSPHNKGNTTSCSVQGEGANPLCGDSVTLGLTVDGSRVADIRFDGHGCAISQSSCSMMTDAVKGKNIKDIESFAKAFKAVFGIQDEKNQVTAKLTEEEMGDLAALEGVKKFPVRIKCAVLPWNALLETLKKLNGK